MSREKFDYTHGSKGIEPLGSLNFESNDRPASQHFDWWWYHIIQAINGHADEFERLDSDNDGIVDKADYALDSDSVDGWDKSDIQNWVNSQSDVPNADHADNAGNSDTIDGWHKSDIKNWVEQNSGSFLYAGDSDPEITESQDVVKDGIINTTNYTIENGVTVDVGEKGYLIIFSSGNVTINGKINANGDKSNGVGATGGSGMVDNSDVLESGGTGAPGALIPHGYGSDEHTNDNVVGGGCGNGDLSLIKTTDLRNPTHIFQQINRKNDDVGSAGPAGSGGGGGGIGIINDNADNEDKPGDNGIFPGGGGVGAEGESGKGYTTSRGGDGGNGGGLVIIIADKINISGNITAGGEDGEDSPIADVAGGGGGGGNGGVIGLYATEIVENSPTYEVTGGSGGSGKGNVYSGGDGADGTHGVVIKSES